MRKYRKIILSIVSIIPLKVFLHFLFSLGETKRKCVKNCYYGASRNSEYELVSSSSINNSIDVVFNEDLWINYLHNTFCFLVF